MEVKLVASTSTIHTYEVRDLAEGKNREIKRYHCADWNDFAAVSVFDLEEIVNQIERLCPGVEDRIFGYIAERVLDEQKRLLQPLF